MINLKQLLLTELRVTDLSKENGRTKYFLLYKDKLFILDRNSPFKTINSRLKRHVKIHPAVQKTADYKWSAIKERGDILDFLRNMADLSVDITVGEYYPENSAIVLWGDVQARSSLNVKKVVQQLGVKNVTMRHSDTATQDDVEIEYDSDKLVGGVPDVVFHGTTTADLKSILKYGLVPGRGQSKWEEQNIYHEEHNFFTAAFQEAIYYAFHAYYVAKKKWNTYPIILELKVPDKSLVGPDYDYDFSTSHPRYFTHKPTEPPPMSTMKATGLSREAGKWSYKGRIPASFIRWVYYYKPVEHKWKKSHPETWARALDKYDWDTLAYRLGMSFDGQL